MKKMKNKINNLILKYTGLVIRKPYPKHSIRFAKKYFKSLPQQEISLV